MNKPWQVIVVLVGIFAAGSVTGGFVTLRCLKQKVANRPVPEEWEPRIIKRLAERIDLTPAQHEQIRPIVKQYMEQVNRVRNNSMAETQTIVEQMQREVSARLTPEQRVKYEQMNRELREAREKAEREKREKAAREKREKEKGDKSAEKPADKPAEKPAQKPAAN